LLIDPFTVIAQIVNFLILVWILRRLLYGPITRAMTARETRIREEGEQARRLREEAQAEGERYRQQVARFEAERDTKLAEARAEVDEWRRTHIQTVRTEVEAMRQRWQQAVQQEKDAFLLEVRHRAGHEVLAATRRALRELADSDLEARLVTRFLARLQEVSPEARTQLATAVRQNGRRVHVRTAYALSEADRERVRLALQETFERDLPTEFETQPDLIAGVELRVGGLKVAWALDDYVASIEDALRDTVGDGTGVDDGRD
jgi:F-type H+-transporting ATPase subunit b